MPTKHTFGNQSKPRSYEIKSFDFTSKKEGSKTAGFADNAMDNPAELNESAMDSSLLALKTMLNGIGITDDEIKGGLTLTQRGYHKVAAALGTKIEFVQSLINSLVKTLNGEDSAAVLSERNIQNSNSDISIMDEIASDVGTMEFPWRLGSRIGMATAAYKSEGDKFYIKVANVYDEHGDVVKLSEAEKKELRRQAIDFIGQE